MKRILSSGEGILHDSYLPNHLYLLRAIKLYTPFLINGGTSKNISTRGQSPPSFAMALSAAVER